MVQCHRDKLAVASALNDFELRNLLAYVTITDSRKISITILG